MPKKEGLDSLQIYKGTWPKTRGVFEGGVDTAMHTMANLLDLINKFLFPVKSSENHIFFDDFKGDRS